MSKFIITKIITPLKNEFKGEVLSIELPTIGGIIGILPGHMPLISALQDGIIKLKSPDGKVFRFEIKHGGFVKFNANVCIITIKSIKPLEKIA